MKNTLKSLAIAACILNICAAPNIFAVSLDKNPYPDLEYGSHFGVAGSMKGDFQISPAGSLQYSIPLDLPDGCGGFKPDISISYDSRQGDGVLGYGFSLSCLSTINRVPSDYFHDSKIKDISLTSEDKLALDGNRMYLSSDGVYSLEINDIWKITANDTNNPQTFTVRKEDGTVYYYGSSSNSRVSMSGVVVKWLLDKVVDCHGNNYTITYVNNYVGQYWIDTIKYSGNSKLHISPQYTLKFSYASRDKGAIYYINDKEFFTNLLLKTIELKYGETLIRKYSMFYKSYIDHLFPYLSSIKLSNQDGFSLSTTQFEWSDTQDCILGDEVTLAIPYANINDMKLYVADFNGDNMRDLLLVYPSSTSKKQKIWKTYVNKGNGRFKYGKTGYLDVNHSQLLIGDFNADGKYDFIEVAVPKKNTYVYYQYISDGESFIKQGNYFQEPRKSTPIVADFNGDGNDDLLLCYDNSSEYRLALVYRGLVPDVWGYSFLYGENTNKWSDNILVADFSGDGMADVINLRADGYDYLHARCGTTFKQITTYAYLKNHGSKITGDFNGDGKIDIMHIDGELCQIFTSTGTGFKAENAPENLKPKDYRFFIADIDGDGTDDVYAIPLTGAHQPIKTFINSNYGLEFKEFTGAKVPPIADIKDLYAADISGNGRADLVCLGSTSTSTLVTDFLSYFLQPDGQRPLITKVTDGLGNYHRAVYTTMNDEETHSITEEYSFPLRQAKIPMPIVSTVFSNNGLGGENKESYKYSDGAYHCMGRGFIGYKKVSMHDHATDTKTVLSFSYFSTNYLPVLDSKTTYLNNKPIEVYSSVNRLLSLPGGTCRAATRSSLVTLYDYDTQKITRTERNEYSYTPTGDVSQHIQVINDCDSIIKTTSYNNDDINWIIGRPATITQRSFINGSPATETEESFQYTGVNLSEKITKKGGKTHLAESFTYSPAGCVTSRTLKAGNESRTEYISYDNNYTHKSEYTDAGGYTSGYTFDTIGLLTSEDCADGLQKTYEYDRLGRLKYWETLNNAYVSAVRWSDGMYSRPENAVYFQYEQYLGKAPQITYYDSFGRKLRVVNTVFGEKEVYTDWFYNSKGQLLKVSRPYFSTDTPVYISYEYDDTGRKICERYPDGTQKMWAFESLGKEGEIVTETNSLGQKTIHHNNFRGQTYKTIDNLGGTIQYSYDTDGNCTSITGPNSSITMDFDEFGNRISMNDSECGSYRFEFNGFGQQTMQLHESTGRSFTTEYDALGRITRREDSDGITDYTYSADRIGLLQSVSNEDTGISISYRYDTKNNVSIEVLTVDDNVYRTYYGYDTQNNLISITYPNFYGIVNEYDDYGNLTGVKHTSRRVTYWELVDVDENNRPCRYRLGNGIIVKRGYDKNTGELISLCDSTVFNWTYSYDSEGNLKSWNKNDLQTTLYQYDGLNRLSGYLNRIIIDKPGIDRPIGPGSITPLSASKLDPQISLRVNNDICYDNAGNITKIGLVDTCLYADGSNRLLSIAAGFTDEKHRPLRWDEITYNSYQKVTKFVSEGRTLNLRYGVNGERIMAEETDSAHTRNILYVSRLYNESTIDGITSKCCNIYAGNLLVALCQNSKFEQPRYYHYDRLGSIVGVSDANGSILERYEYTPWGLKTCTLNTSDSISSERRGFTGHEHIDLLDLVNMNGRIYDPYIGRFITPDPFVQAPDNTQSLNRYAYCANNPLKYTDPSGDLFIIDDFVVGFFKGLFSGKNPLKTGFHHAANSAKIWWGLYVTDSNKSFFGRIWEFASRLSFQSVQTCIGFLYAHISNQILNVKDIDYAYGTTVIKAGFLPGRMGVTIGNYITGGRGIEASPYNPTFQHEYGHYIQSQRLGFAYLPVIGFPSLASANKGDGKHRTRRFEMNANYLAFMYFNKNIPGFYKSADAYIKDGQKAGYQGWNFYLHPLVNNPEIEYVNYEDSQLLNQIRENTSLKVRFWNYLFPIIPNF